MLKVVYLAGGYPTDDNLSHGIFNERAVEAIKDFVDLTLIHYRIYKPGRNLFEVIEQSEFTHIVLCIPFLPICNRRLYGFTNAIFRLFTRKFCHKYLKKADIVHASDANFGVFTAQLKDQYDFRLLVQCIGGDINQDLRHQIGKPFLNGWLNKLDAVSFNSRSLKDRFIELFGDHHSTTVIYRGVDVNVFTAELGRQIDQVLKFYFLGGMPNYRTFEHGRNTKGGQTLMNAWVLIDEAFPLADVELLFAGPDSNIREVLHWRSSLKKPERVKIIGNINPADIAAFHRSGDVALLPSMEEGLPNAGMEAMASGNLIIATKVGGIPEILEQGVNGILVEPNQPQQLAEAIKRVILSPEIIEKFGKENRRKMKKEFNCADFGRKYYQIYSKITSE